MRRNPQRSFLTALIAVLSGLLVSAFAIPALAQAVAPDASRGIPQDWSHKHLLYTNPDTRDEAARKGTFAFEQWKEKHKDPRFALQAARKARFVETTEQRPFSGQQLQWANRHRRDPPPAGPEIHRDWSNVMGGAAGVGKAGVFPAKFQFDINATASCANDFVVYTTASSGATGSGVLASQTGTFTGAPANAQTATITNGTRSLVLTASTTLNTLRNFLIGGTTTITATNLRDAINRNGGTVGVTASSSTNVVTVTAITHGTGGNSIGLTDTLANFTWAGATLAGGSGTAGQPTIIAFNQLYSSCGTTTTPVPATFWSYNTGAAGFTETSPVLSIDGAQMAFVQRTGTAASLVLLKWSSSASVGTVGAPTAPSSVAAASYQACAAPCMTVIAFSGGPNNTNSSPFYDYTNDNLYVGANNGTLHKFTGIFNGTPAEQTTGGFPATVSTGNLLSSPVYDSGSGLVFAGSTSGAASGGSLHSVNSAGTVVSSARLATNTSSGVRDAPIVDSTAQTVYAFVGSDVSGTDASCSTAPCMAVIQFPTTFTGASTGTKVRVGHGVTSTTQRFLYAGTFDNAYYTSGTPASPSGMLYVCGGRLAGTGTQARPTLWQIPIASNVMGTPVVGPLLVSANTNCSPVTEIADATNDYLFVSVIASGSATGCTGACVYMYKNLLSGALWGSTSVAWGTTVVPNAGLAATGGASGIIIDNISSTTGASQVYYSTLTSPGNAVQASQAALQ